MILEHLHISTIDFQGYLFMYDKNLKVLKQKKKKKKKKKKNL